MPLSLYRNIFVVDSSSWLSLELSPCDSGREICVCHFIRKWK